MKNFILIILAALMLASIASCADSKTIDGKTYRPYGLINEKDCKADSIHYEVAIDATIAGVIFVETVITPIYVFGFNFYEPICKESEYHPGLNATN